MTFYLLPNSKTSWKMGTNQLQRRYFILVLHCGVFYNIGVKDLKIWWFDFWSKELKALIQYKINEGHGLPSSFTTGSCAEFYFKPLKRLLSIYIKETIFR